MEHKYLVVGEYELDNKVQVLMFQAQVQTLMFQAQVQAPCNVSGSSSGADTSGVAGGLVSQVNWIAGRQSWNWLN